MANRVIGSAPIKTIMNAGRPIALKYATETDAWKRYALSTDVQEGFTKAMEKAAVPSGATTAIMTSVTLRSIRGVRN